MTLSRDAFDAIFNSLWWSLMDYEPPQGKIGIYYRELRAYDAQTIKKIADELAMSSDRFPKLDVWRAMCYKAKSQKEQVLADIEPANPKNEAIGAIMLPYYTGKLTGAEAYNRLKAVYSEFGGDLDSIFGGLKDGGLFKFGKPMPQEDIE